MLYLCFQRKGRLLGHNVALVPHAFIRKILPVKLYIKITWRLPTPADWFKK